MTTITWYDNDTKTQNRFHTSFCAFRAERGVFLELTMLAKEFVFDCQARELAPRTIRNYEKQISYFIRYLEEVQNVTLLEELKPIHIKQYVVMLVKKKHKPAYTNDLLKAVKCLCAYAFEEGYTEELLTKKVKNVREPKVLIHTFSNDEIKRMIQAALRRLSVSL